MRFKRRNVLYAPGVGTVHGSTYAPSSVRQRHSRAPHGRSSPRALDPPTRAGTPHAREITARGGSGAPFLFPVGITIREPRLTIGPVTCITFPALRIIKNFRKSRPESKVMTSNVIGASVAPFHSSTSATKSITRPCIFAREVFCVSTTRDFGGCPMC